MVLEIYNVTKRYGKKTALDNISLTLNKGITGLIGPNGAGKSTLINILVGLLRPQSGTVTYNGTPIEKAGASYLDILGYLPQTPGFYKNYTGFEFLDYLCRLKGISSADIPARVDRVLEVVRLAEERGKKIGAYSGGMRQRLGIAQAIINNPEVLILDEPTAGLDPRERIHFRNMISGLGNDRIVLLATHIVTDIEFIADHVVLLKNGRAIRSGSPDELLREVDGSVWELETEESKIDCYTGQYPISNIVRRESGHVVRMVSKSPPENAVSVRPGLEDVFLYHFGGE